jgi:hypothetical protein
MEEWYAQLIAARGNPVRPALDAAAALPRLVRLGAYKVRRRRAKRRGPIAADDFNVVRASNTTPAR